MAVKPTQPRGPRVSTIAAKILTPSVSPRKTRRQLLSELEPKGLEPKGYGQASPTYPSKPHPP